jgi:Na+/proline symporter
MIMFLDILYVVCCNFYKKREKNSFEISGLILLTGVFCSNVLFVFFIVSQSNQELFNYQKLFSLRYYIIGLSIILFMSLLFIRYFRFTDYNYVFSKIESLNESKKSVLYIGAILYVFISLGAILAYALYRAWLLSNWAK